MTDPPRICCEWSGGGGGGVGGWETIHPLAFAASGLGGLGLQTNPLRSQMSGRGNVRYQISKSKKKEKKNTFRGDGGAGDSTTSSHLLRTEWWWRWWVGDDISASRLL